jgi:hypothetical protein
MRDDSFFGGGSARGPRCWLARRRGWRSDGGARRLWKDGDSATRDPRGWKDGLFAAQATEAENRVRVRIVLTPKSVVGLVVHNSWCFGHVYWLYARAALAQGPGPC